MRSRKVLRTFPERICSHELSHNWLLEFIVALFRYLRSPWYCRMNFDASYKRFYSKLLGYCGSLAPVCSWCPTPSDLDLTSGWQVQVTWCSNQVERICLLNLYLISFRPISKKTNMPLWNAAKAKVCYTAVFFFQIVHWSSAGSTPVAHLFRLRFIHILISIIYVQASRFRDCAFFSRRRKRKPRPLAEISLHCLRGARSRPPEWK